MRCLLRTKTGALIIVDASCAMYDEKKEAIRIICPVEAWDVFSTDGKLPREKANILLASWATNEMCNFTGYYAVSDTERVKELERQEEEEIAEQMGIARPFG